jgi:arginase family enzyme
VIAVLDAPSVLGLRPPAPGKVPGALRLPEVLRANFLLERLGAGGAGRAVATLAGRGVEGFWVHLDTDVLDPEMMPAVDSPEPGGLTDTVVAGLRPRAA